MADDEQQIRTLVERWAEAAVHSGDLSGVLVDHSDDILMFDGATAWGRPRHRRLP